MRSLPILLAALLVACGPTPTRPDGGTDIAGCLNDPRVTPYAAGMQTMSSSGELRFQLVQSDPAPPIRGTNSWTMKVFNGAGTSIDGLALKATTFMPDHGHGSSIVPEVTALPAGGYSVANLYLFMPGVWRITLATTTDGGLSDSAQFLFCIEG